MGVKCRQQQLLNEEEGGNILFGCFIVDAALQYPTLTAMSNLI